MSTPKPPPSAPSKPETKPTITTPSSSSGSVEKVSNKTADGTDKGKNTTDAAHQGIRLSAGNHQFKNISVSFITYRGSMSVSFDSYRFAKDNPIDETVYHAMLNIPSSKAGKICMKIILWMMKTESNGCRKHFLQVNTPIFGRFTKRILFTFPDSLLLRSSVPLCQQVRFSMRSESKGLPANDGSLSLTINYNLLSEWAHVSISQVDEILRTNPEINATTAFNARSFESTILNKNL